MTSASVKKMNDLQPLRLDIRYLPMCIAHCEIDRDRKKQVRDLLDKIVFKNVIVRLNLYKKSILTHSNIQNLCKISSSFNSPWK